MLPYFENPHSNIFTGHETESYNFPSHFHNSIELAYCVCGFQNIKVNDEIYTMTDGDALIIFPNCTHEYIAYDKSVPTEITTMVCKPEFFTDFIPELKLCVPETPLIRAAQLPPNVADAFVKVPHASSKLELFGLCCIAISGITQELIMRPRKTFSDVKLAPELISYIHANYTQPLTINMLSKKFGYHPSYIAHIFSDYLKIPFRSYLGAIRSEAAASIICSTDKSITEIAYECGFGSINTFCRCFKKHFGITPSQYRKKQKNE